MTYERFEDVPVWQTAAELYEAAEDLLAHDAFPASRGWPCPDLVDRWWVNV